MKDAISHDVDIQLRILKTLVFLIANFLPYTVSFLERKQQYPDLFEATLPGGITKVLGPYTKDTFSIVEDVSLLANPENQCLEANYLQKMFAFKLELIYMSFRRHSDVPAFFLDTQAIFVRAEEKLKFPNTFQNDNPTPVLAAEIIRGDAELGRNIQDHYGTQQSDSNVFSFLIERIVARNLLYFPTVWTLNVSGVVGMVVTVLSATVSGVIGIVESGVGLSVQNWLLWLI
ncbi:hypothetical protein DFH29DRAFT_877625 [Suillus ampliporus]|nr:hypothetical protein DFH29DRAFT_877625 [Suillus ampliporus]